MLTFEPLELIYTLLKNRSYSSTRTPNL